MQFTEKGDAPPYPPRPPQQARNLRPWGLFKTLNVAEIYIRWTLNSERFNISEFISRKIIGLKKAPLGCIFLHVQKYKTLVQFLIS